MLDITQYFDNLKSSSISQSIHSKSTKLKKLIKYFNGTTVFVSNVLALSGGLPINFALYSKKMLVVVLLLFILF